MQEAAYATLTSQLHAYFETGKPPPRLGNASHGRVPLNVYPAKDGYVAINIALEEHWYNLLQAMGREDLRDDPRFADNAARVANREPTDAVVAAWTKTLGKMEAFAIAKQYRIPLAPVREVDEVMHDRRMHERGMLEWIEHDEIGRIVVPTKSHASTAPTRSRPWPVQSSVITTARSAVTGSVCRPMRSKRSNERASNSSRRNTTAISSFAVIERFNRDFTVRPVWDESRSSISNVGFRTRRRLPESLP